MTRTGESGDVAGGLPGGVHPGYFGIVDLGTTGQCTSDPDAYCESVFITVANPLTEEDIAAGKTSRRANLDIVLTPTHPVADFDLVLYSSNADGDVLGEAAMSGGAPIADSETSSESVYLPVVTREAMPELHFVAHVVYFAAPSDYAMTVDFD